MFLVVGKNVFYLKTISMAFISVFVVHGQTAFHGEAMLFGNLVGHTSNACT